MPELPDVIAYVEALQSRLPGQQLGRVRLNSPFLLRSVEPQIEAVSGRTVQGIGRIGKRIVIELDSALFLVIHLMIAGRLHWKKPGIALRSRNDLAAFDFHDGSLVLTEASHRKRTSLIIAQGEKALVELDPGGLDVFQASEPEFQRRLRESSHTLKRALTDPRVLDGIGNAYSDEILHAARLSPFRMTSQLTDEEGVRLLAACRTVLGFWIEKLREETAGRFPEKVTAFREGMAVHGRFRKPCPICSTPIQRILYAESESNYCPVCQTGGRLLADRALSRLLKEDWPRTVDELEERRSRKV